jgi:hypothetical protein
MARDVIDPDQDLLQRKTPMTTSMSRRGFLTKASVGVAAGVAASVAATSGIATAGSLLAAPVTTDIEAPDVTPVGEDVVAHVRNASTGEVSLMVGHTELVYHDRALVGRLLKGARRARQEA